jgi:hypothetical protein
MPRRDDDDENGDRENPEGKGARGQRSPRGELTFHYLPERPRCSEAGPARRLYVGLETSLSGRVRKHSIHKTAIISRLEVPPPGCCRNSVWDLIAVPLVLAEGPGNPPDNNCSKCLTVRRGGGRMPDREQHGYWPSWSEFCGSWQLTEELRPQNRRRR